MKAGDFSIGSDNWAGLSKLIEEAGEVIQVAGKLIATGGESAHWDGTDLRARLTGELADLEAAIDFVVAVNDLDRHALAIRRQGKWERFWAWHRDQGVAGAR